MIDYRKFRLRLLNTPEFSHLKLLLFWPLHGLCFGILENGIPGRSYFPVESFIDAYIPFCEYFVIPYIFWFAYLIGMIIYGCLFDLSAFRKYMYFTIVTYGITLVIYMIFPTCQNLRPTEFASDNAFTRFIADFYAFDTHTNVCPSIHVLGSIAVSYGAWNSKHFHSSLWRIAFTVTTVLISASTVFMKQHSIIDVIASVLLSIVAVPICIKLENITMSRLNLKKKRIKANKEAA